MTILIKQHSQWTNGLLNPYIHKLAVAFLITSAFVPLRILASNQVSYLYFLYLPCLYFSNFLGQIYIKNQKSFLIVVALLSKMIKKET